MKHVLLLIITLSFLFVGCNDDGATPTIIPLPTELPSPTLTPTPTEFLTSPPPPLQAHFIDVGQGDAILIDYGGTEVLIDGGPKSSDLVDYLRDYVDGTLDIVVATHPHADHIGGLVSVLETFDVEEVWHNGDTSTSKTYQQFMQSVEDEGAEVNVARLHDRIETGPLSFYVHHPAEIVESTNNNSIVLHLQFGEIDFLFTGDAEQEAEEQMMMLSSVRVPEVEILKVGHHASRTASSEDFLRITIPEVAIYMAKEDNQYGHPHDETITNLTDMGAEIYGTDVKGTIVVATKGSDYTVRFEKEIPPPTPTVIPTNVPCEEVVTIPDPALDAAIRTAIGKPTGDLCKSALSNLTQLDISQQGISDLTGLEYCTGLNELNLANNEPPWNYSDLEKAELLFNRISDISALSNLTNLTTLHLVWNEISDISPLSNLTSLTILTLAFNQIEDISSLSGLTELTTLTLAENQISDISALSALTKLEGLFLLGNQITDISPLSALINITNLRLDMNQINDISPLSNLTALTDLELGLNRIKDISVCANFTQLERLSSSGNQISDISSLSMLTDLESVNLQGNQITDISSLSALTNVYYLNLYRNSITDISALLGLPNLSMLFIDANEVSDISPLLENSGIDAGDKVGLSDNPLSEISINNYIPQLGERGVEVTWE